MMDVRDSMSASEDGPREGTWPAGQHPIEVVLSPPKNPEDYVIIPRSKVLAKVLSYDPYNVEEGMPLPFYQVELTSSHIDRVSRLYIQSYLSSSQSRLVLLHTSPLGPCCSRIHQLVHTSPFPFKRHRSLITLPRVVRFTLQVAASDCIL